MNNQKCKKCGGDTSKGWVNYATKYYCKNKDCELFDKPENG